MRGPWGRLVLVVTLVVAGVALVLWRFGRAGGSAKEEVEEQVATEVPVRVAALTRTTLQSFVEAFGTVEPAPAEADRPAAGARLSSPVTGVVASVLCAEGQLVESGKQLIRLDTRLTNARVANAEKATAFAEQTLARQKSMFASGATSQRALQDAEQQLAAARGELAAALAERASLFIEAPLSGTVLKVNVTAGAAVSPSDVLVELADLDRLVVSAGIPGEGGGLVKPGQAARLTARDNGRPLAGNVVFVGSRIDDRSDTVPVRIALPTGSGLLPGAFVDLRIVVVTRRDCLAAPRDAIVRDPEGRTAVAVVEGDMAVLKPVTTGVRDRGLVEVAGEGLTEGTSVVVEGAYGLPAKTRIKVVGP